MRFFLVLQTIVMGFLFAVSPASAKGIGKYDRICAGMTWDTCKESERVKVRKAFGLHHLKINREEGAEIVRAFRQNANGWNEMALIFSRGYDLLPQVEFRRPLKSDGTNWRAPLIAKIPEKMWQELIAEGRGFDAPFEDNGGCMDGHTSIIEALDSDGTIRTRVEHSCSEGPGNKYFEYLTAVAVAQFPYCAAIEHEDTSRGDATRLLNCSALDGDRMAAAELFNLLEKNGFWCCGASERDFARIEHLFDEGIEYSWPGVPTIRDKALAAKAWLNDRGGRRDFYGESHDRVRIEGRATVRETETEDLSEYVTTPYSQIWIRGRDGQFRMVSSSFSFDHMVLSRSYNREQYARMHAKLGGKMPPRLELLSRSEAESEARFR